ncbi:MAG TPA: hypothetical protein VE398_18455 [Acidobacteriota bacterium]|nr:hypothetical protein [Acidobacteriota bacterium]
MHKDARYKMVAVGLIVVALHPAFALAQNSKTTAEKLGYRRIPGC